VSLVLKILFLYQNDEKNLSNHSKELHATNGHGESHGAGASRINEVDSSILVGNKKTREESLGDGHQDGPQPKKRSLHRLTSKQSEILEGYGSLK
jgi:hypothetical protein